MLNKKVIISLIIIIIILFTGFIIYEQNQVKLGEIHMSVPEGFHIEYDNSSSVNSSSSVHLTNGYEKLTLDKYSDKNTDLNANVQGYINSKNESNITVKKDELNLSGELVYRTVIDDNGTNTSHYWFKHDNIIYEISSVNSNPHTDVIVSELIKSIRKSIFSI